MLSKGQGENVHGRHARQRVAINARFVPQPKFEEPVGREYSKCAVPGHPIAERAGNSALWAAVAFLLPFGDGSSRAFGIRADAQLASGLRCFAEREKGLGALLAKAR